ncbi:MAG: nucleotide pyrophosphatase/phosphodiesterase family protein [Chloroflexota bacterium]
MKLPSEFVLPNYNGRSLANVPATVAKLLNVTFKGAHPLQPALWQPLGSDIQRVVVFLVDALGWNIIQRQQEKLSPLLARAQVADTITSVFPSTTVNALSSIWTGTPPAQHGLVGLRLFFPEYAVLGQMIKLKPNFYDAPDALTKAGLKAKDFLATPGASGQFVRQRVAVHHFKGHEIVDSALSVMHGRGSTADHGATTVADMLVKTRQLIENNLDKKLFAYLYWPTVDTLSHAYGPFGEAVTAEVHTILHQVETILMDGLSAAAKKGTAVIIMSDHGQTNTPISQHVYVDDHPHLKKMLLMRSAGEPRVPVLYAKQGKVQAVLDYINSELSETAVALTSDEALDLGLLGNGPYAPHTRDRLGDIVMIMRNGALYLNPEEVSKAQKTNGRHGGLTADEMNATWLGFRLA